MTQTQIPFLSKATDGMRTMLGVGGLVAAVLGLLILIFPAKSADFAIHVIAAIIAAYAFVSGVVYIGGAIFSRYQGGWARFGHILLGLLFILGGVVMAVNLGATGAVLAVFLTVTIGVLWLFEGIMSFTMVSHSSNKGWTVFYGIVSVLAGIALLFSPLMGAITLWLLVGISMLVLGILQAIRAFTMKTVTAESVDIVE